MDILVEHNPGKDRLDSLGIGSWPIWSCEASEFPWRYESRETCYLLEGEVLVSPEVGEPVSIKAGDLVIFPAGMSCRWKVIKPVSKHYRFD
ncbi:cupin domain-containing protein [Geobacter sp. DSM 9736]|uniref:cupin domain-containing protein n=1 Tax=Geobacter sp. DSM 9736 TaxID=1277350 RepID=UPI000B4FD729|nr:cupin domain-containing protein [Geobacter sp. DSM 9736]